MRNTLVRSLAAAAILAGAAPLAVLAQQSYPAKPVRFIMPFPPGEGGDIVLRRAAQELNARFGQPVVVDNRGGGTFVIGAEACMNSAPDGYTVCVINGTMMSINPHVMSKIPYDPERSFRPLTNMYFLIGGLYTNMAVPVASVKELGAQGLDPAAGAPEEFAEFLRRDREETGVMVKKFNIPRQ